ncbi:MAG: hypothetical protein J4F40_19685 [Alphaproteobacteria bacterium]|nr:hypothetical protein [Alphaproteobacteria bacterium]
MSDLLFRIETSALGQLMRDSIWLFPMAEILHFMGLSLLIGSLLVVDCRLLGLARGFPVAAIYKFLPLALTGFSINPRFVITPTSPSVYICCVSSSAGLTRYISP